MTMEGEVGVEVEVEVEPGGQKRQVAKRNETAHTGRDGTGRHDTGREGWGAPAGVIGRFVCSRDCSVSQRALAMVAEPSGPVSRI